MANVDQIVLVMSLSLPPFDARQATRFLVSAEAANIPVLLLLNKADLLEDHMTQALISEVTTLTHTRTHPMWGLVTCSCKAAWLSQNIL